MAAEKRLTKKARPLSGRALAASAASRPLFDGRVRHAALGRQQGAEVRPEAAIGRGDERNEPDRGVSEGEICTPGEGRTPGVLHSVIRAVANDAGAAPGRSPRAATEYRLITVERVA